MAAIWAEDYEQLVRLEESLWRADSRFDRQLMEQTLASDFFEFGRSGRTYKREEALSDPAQPINAKLPLPKFDVRLIAADVALVTYVSEVTYGDATEFANRSSIWSRVPNGWRLRFHQGTPVENTGHLD